LDSSSSKGSDTSDSSNASRIGVAVVVINGMTMVWPVMRMVLIGKVQEYYEKVTWVLGFPYRCYMSYCGGEKRAAAAREKAKEERVARRRAAGFRRQASQLHMDETELMLALRADLALAEQGSGQRSVIHDDLLDQTSTRLLGERSSFHDDIEIDNGAVQQLEISMSPAGATLGIQSSSLPNRGFNPSGFKPKTGRRDQVDGLGLWSRAAWEAGLTGEIGPMDTTQVASPKTRDLSEENADEVIQTVSAPRSPEGNV